MREKRIDVRVSDDELLLFREKATRSGMKNVSDYLRFSAANLYIYPPVDSRITKAITRWSANLNQIAHHANATGELFSEDIRLLRQAAIDIIKTIERARA